MTRDTLISVRAVHGGHKVICHLSNGDLRLGALFIDYCSLALFSHLFSLFFLSHGFIIHLYVSVNSPERHSTFCSSTLPLHQKTISRLLRAASSWSTPTLSLAPIHLHSVSFIHSHIPLPSPVNGRDGLWLLLPTILFHIAVFHQPTSFLFLLKCLLSPSKRKASLQHSLLVPLSHCIPASTLCSGCCIIDGLVIEPFSFWHAC